MELKEQLDDIRSRLEQEYFTNETAVRQGIVDRLLTALGWPIFDTQIVFPEYSVDTGRVDYALCHPVGKPLVFIEVKRVGNIEAAERQLFEYAFHGGIPILILTDGQKWRFFHPSGSGDYQERLVCELDLIADDSEGSTARLNRYLNYESVRTGTAGQAIAEDYQKISQQWEALRHLPEAWENLVSDASEDSEFLIEAVQSETERLCGSRPTDEEIFIFLSNLRTETGTDPDPQTKTRERSKAQRQQRQVDSNDVKPSSPDPRPRSISPKREKYRSYFQELIDELREQHNFTKVRDGKPQNDHFFSSGFRGIWYHVNFGRQSRVYTSLYIDFENHEENKNFFDVLKERESEINAKFGNVLSWERRNEHRLSTIRLMQEGDIDADASELEAIRAWHIENLLKFKEVFTPEIELALETLSSRETEPE